MWEAEDPETGEPVAIETLAGEAARDEDVSEWFTEAWELAAGSRGPRGGPRPGGRRAGGVPFAVRTPAGEMTLADRLEEAEARSSPGAALQVLSESPKRSIRARGGVVHGDLGPAAVVLDEQGRAYLAGFGRREGDRREDIRFLGELLAEMLGAVPEETEPKAEMDRRRSEPDDEARGGEPEDGQDEDEKAKRPTVDGEERTEAEEDDPPEVVSEYELALAEVLREVGQAGADGEFSRASELVAEAKAARPESTPGPARRRRRGRNKLVIAAAAIVVVVIVLLLLGSGGDEEDGDPTPGTNAATNIAA